MSNLEPNFKDLTDRELLVLIADMVAGHSGRIKIIEHWQWVMSGGLMFLAGANYKQVLSMLALIGGIFK